MAQTPLCTRAFGPDVWENNDAPAGAVNTPRGLTHSSGTSREGLGMEPTHDPADDHLDIGSGHLESLRLVSAIGGMDHDVRTAVLSGAPFSKAAPRYSRRGGTYVPKKDREAEERTALELLDRFPEPYTGNVALACIFYRPNFQRIDVDNMLKHVCDAATGVLWLDDSQVTALVGTAYLDVDDPRTLIAAAPHESTLSRGSDANYPCVICAKPISRVGQASLRKTCSRECRAVAMGNPVLDAPTPCVWCGEPFKRVSSYRKYCSIACRGEAFRNIRKAAARPPVLCPSCSAPLVHRRGGRCRACWRADPKGLLLVDPQSTVPVSGDEAVEAGTVQDQDGLR